jgi:hypothetical protein
MTERARTSDEESRGPEASQEGPPEHVRATETTSIPRRFVQPEALITYSDYVQISRTENEVILQFYVTIPGMPEGPKVQEAVTRLVATIVLTSTNARRLGNTLMATMQQE